MPDITFITPFAKHHEMIVQRALESVRQQSVPCRHIILRDTDGRGPGYMRNRGLEQTQTDYIVFLDADDTVAPNFAEKCLEAIKPDHFVYTDWHDGNGRYGRAPTPCKVWTEKTFHLVTTLMRADDARRIGGFDENLPGGEDTDFGVRLRASGVCGVHIAQALVMYQAGGQRSTALHGSITDLHIQRYFTERYGGIQFMGCCGADYNTPIPLNEKQDGDILVVANWAGNRPFVGPITGRSYGVRVGNFRAFWIAPDDVQATAGMWKQPEEKDIQRTILTPQYQAEVSNEPPWQAVADAILGNHQTQPTQPSVVEYKPPVSGRSKSAVISAAQKDKP